MHKDINGNNAYKQESERQEYKQQVRLEPRLSVKIRLYLVQFANIMLIAVVLFCALSLVHGYTSVTVITKEISELNSNLDTLKSQEISLNAQVDKMFNLEHIENYAIEMLGMVKLDQNQIEQVYIQNIDTIEVFENTTKFNEFSQYFKGIFSSIIEYIK